MRPACRPVLFLVVLVWFSPLFAEPSYSGEAGRPGVHDVRRETERDVRENERGRFREEHVTGVEEAVRKKPDLFDPKNDPKNGESSFRESGKTRADRYQDVRTIDRLPEEARKSWLFTHEGGDHDGHLLRNHVPDVAGKENVERQIQERFSLEPKQTYLSMFNNVHDAEKAVEENLDHNREKIDRWLRDSSSRNVEPFDWGHDWSPGIGMRRGESTSIELSKSHIVLRKDGRGGYHIETGWLLPSDGKGNQE